MFEEYDIGRIVQAIGLELKRVPGVYADGWCVQQNGYAIPVPKKLESLDSLIRFLTKISYQILCEDKDWIIKQIEDLENLYENLSNRRISRENTKDTIKNMWEEAEGNVIFINKRIDQVLEVNDEVYRYDSSN